MTTDRNWYTPEQMAEIIRIPVGTMKLLIKSGRGPIAYKFGSHIRVKREDFELWTKNSYEERKTTDSTLEKTIGLNKSKKAHPAHSPDSPGSP